MYWWITSVKSLSLISEIIFEMYVKSVYFLYRMDTIIEK